jgi:hypothetical protein
MKVKASNLSDNLIHQLAELTDSTIDIGNGITISPKDLDPRAFGIIAKKMNIYFNVEPLTIPTLDPNIGIIMSLFHSHFPGRADSRFDPRRFLEFYKAGNKLEAEAYVLDTYNHSALFFNSQFKEATLFTDDVFATLKEEELL